VYRRWAEECLCVLLLLAGAVLALYPGLFGGAVPMALQGPLFMAPWEEARPAGLSPLESSFHAQHSQRYYPWFDHLSRTGTGEASVLWMESEGFGAPFLAQWRSRALSPFSLPFYLTDLHLAITLSFLLKLLVAGLCAYYAARRFGFAPATALFAGICWQWAGPVFLWSAMPLSDLAVWLPLLVLFWERAALGVRGTFTFGAIVLLLILISGAPEGFLFLALLGPLYVLLRLWPHRPTPALGTAMKTYGAALAAAMLLGAVQLVPWLEYVWHSAPSLRGPALLPSLRDAAAALSPHWLPQSRTDASHIAGLLHVGLVPLAALPLYLVARPFFDPGVRSRIEALVGLALAAAFVSYLGSGVWHLIPGQFGAQHGLLLLPLALILLVAALLEEWIEFSRDEATEAFLRLQKVALPLWLAILGFGVVLVLATPEATWAGLAVLLAIILAVCAVAVLTLIRPKVRYAGYGFAAVSIVALAWAWLPVMPRTPEAQVFPETGFIAKLQEMDARVGGSQGIQHWPLAGNGIAQVFSPSGVRLSRFELFAEALERDPLLLRRSGAEALLLTREDIQGVFGPVRPVLNIQEVFPSGAILFRDLEAQPRARMIFQGRRIEKPESGLLHSDSPALVEGARLPEEGGSAPDVRIVEENRSPLTRHYSVQGAKPGLLVTTEMWYPGWRASVDGRSAEVYPVDLVFRGVELGEGNHQVVFRYSPASVRWGSVLSALGVLLVFLGTAPFNRILPERWRL